MINLFIPPIGTKLRLAEPWVFDLHAQYQNLDIYEVLVGAPIDTSRIYSRTGHQTQQWVLLEGTVLAISRLQVRRGLAVQNSMVTFRLIETPDPRFRPPKKQGTFEGSRLFWAKLLDVNRIKADVVET